MCGIAGFSGSFEPGLVDRMTAALAHRGPDGEGVYRAEGVGLGHRRLAILDVSPAGAQPMWDESRRCVIAYNGELYNFPDLKRELEQAGVGFSGRSDTEVLVNLYARTGPAMLQRLNGMFAFAVHDVATGETLLARDRFGVKPLYFAETREGVLFASEIKALLVCPSLDREIDRDAVLAHLVHLWSPAPATMLSRVRKLEPGCAMTLRAGKVTRQWRYHDPFATEVRPADPGEAAERVKEALRTAVERQMISDVPVGAFLSGGLDSSAVAAFAQRVAPDRRLQCFTIDLDEAASRVEGLAPDLPFARLAARELGVDLHEVRVGPEIVDDLERMVFHLDEPQGDPAALNVLRIAALARGHGVKVLLSGVGGDDLFTGYRRHRALQAERFWSWLPASARRLLQSGARGLPARPPSLRRLAKAFAHAGLDPDVRLARHLAWLDPDVAAALTTGGPASPRQDRLALALAEMPAGASRLQKMLALEQRYFLSDHNLNYADKMSMAEGVETRVPFLDNDLADLARSLPDDLKQRGGEGKWILKQAMAGILPASIVNRPKTGFGAPLRSWLAGPLRPLLRDILASRSFAERGLWRRAAIDDLAAESERGRIDASYTLFTILCIELWFRAFVDPPAGVAGLGRGRS